MGQVGIGLRSMRVGTATLCLLGSAAAQPPSNDDCGAAIAIVAAQLPFTTTISTTAATTAESDPLQSCNPTGASQHYASVWYQFTAAMNGLLIADTFGSDYDTVLSAHSGTCGDLDELACDEDTAGRQSRIGLEVVAGETVYLEVSSFEPGGGNLVLNLIATPGLPNDDCADAMVIDSLPFAAMVDTTTATSEAGDPLQACTPGQPASNTYSVWYRYTEPATSTRPRDIVVTTSGSSYENVLSAFTGGCAAFSEVACNSGFRTSEIRLAVAPGQTVYFEVTHAPFFDPPGGGTLLVQVADEVAINDECADATVVGATPFFDTTYTGGATTSPLDPVQGCVGSAAVNSNSVWYRYVSPQDASLTIDTAGSDFDTVVSAYRGTCANLQSVACDDDDGDARTSRAVLPVAGGEPLLIEVTDFGLQVGGGVLRLQLVSGTPLPTPTPGATPTPQTRCAADCNNDGSTSINELILAVRLALRTAPIDDCKSADINTDGSVTIAELISAVDSALNACD